VEEKKQEELKGAQLSAHYMVTDHVAGRLNKTLTLKQAVGLAIASVVVALWASSQLNPCRLGEENLALREQVQFQEGMNIVLTDALFLTGKYAFRQNNTGTAPAVEIGDKIGPAH